MVGDIAMKRTLTLIGAAATAVVGSAAPSLAAIWWPWPPKPPTQVPEIDASTGLLAIAAVIAVLAFAAERRRRAR